MKYNKSITKCLNDHYSMPNKDITIIDKKVLYTYDKMCKSYQNKTGKPVDALLLLAALDKVGLDNIKKIRSK